MFPIKHLQFVTSCPPVKNAVSAHCSESSLLPHYQPLRWTKICTAPRQHEKLPLPFAAEWKLHPSPSFFPSSSPVFHMFPHFSHHFWCCPRLSPIRTCPQPPPAWSQHRLLPHLLLHQRRRRGRARQQRMGRGLSPVASKEEAQGVLDDVSAFLAVEKLGLFLACGWYGALGRVANFEMCHLRSLGRVANFKNEACGNGGIGFDFLSF